MFLKPCSMVVPNMTCCFAIWMLERTGEVDLEVKDI